MFSTSFSIKVYFEFNSLLRAKFTLHNDRGELVRNIVRRHVTVQLEFVTHVHSYIKQLQIWFNANNSLYWALFLTLTNNDF
jgi:hypothetical protein